MKLIIDGQINKYYVQTLCMIFFPGASFGEDEREARDNPTLELKLTSTESGVFAYAEVRYEDRICSAKKYADYPGRDRASCTKIDKQVTGAAVLAAMGDLTGYRPSWGMLTGVRPSKVATELLRAGISKTRARRTLSGEYAVIPKKAALATEVALNEARIIGKPERRDCSVYISIPFCPTRCAYCSFVSYSSRKLLGLIPDYLERLCAELETTFGTIERLGLRLKTVYIGGGTPTILTPEQLDRLLGTVAEHCDPSLLEEYTLEAGRPDTITEAKLRTAIRHGVGRISVNPQTLNNEILAAIGRSHTAEDFIEAFHIAREVGVPCINTDMIVGLPGDRFPLFSESFDKILALRPENITVHTFCVKKAAEIRQSDVYSRSGGDAGKCVDYSQIKSSQAGYRPYYMYRQKNTVGNYENVGFAREGFEGRYNIYMMEETHSIFAAGAGAVTKLVRYGGGNESSVIKRLFNPKYPYEYLADDRRDDIRRQTEEFYDQYIFNSEKK